VTAVAGPAAGADRPGPFDCRRQVVALHGRSPEQTLLRAVAEALRTDPLGATGGTVDLEGHGRDILPDADAAAVIGWFTALFPLTLPDDATDVAAHLREARRHGSAYGVLRWHGDPAKAVQPTARVALNYVGRAGAPGPNAPWMPVGAPLRAFGERELAAGRDVEIDAAAIGDELLVDFAVRRTRPAAELADRVVAALAERALCPVGHDPDQPEVSP
jgi:hypothetical protein